MPSTIHDLYYLTMLGFLTGGTQPETKGKVGVDLDVACASSSLIPLKHQQIEFFVPVDLLREVGAYLDNRFEQGYYPYVLKHGLFNLRFVFGSNSLTAANGVLADGTLPNFIAVNIDSFQRSQWEQYNTELNEMMADLSAEFPQQLRNHPGKYNPPLSPDPESQDVKDLIAQFDPDGLFAREPYNATYLTKSPNTKEKWFLPF